MANGHVEVHDPISNYSNLKKSTDSFPKSTSDTSDMEDTVEFRILMAYAQRRRPKTAAPNSRVRTQSKMDANGTAPSQIPAKAEQKESNGKKKGWKRVLSILKCVQPQKEEEPHQTEEEEHDEVEPTEFHPGKVEEEDTLVEIVSRLTEIADEIPFTPSEIESDNPDDVERAIGLILRESGDRLNEQDLNHLKQLFWDYNLFRSTITALLTVMGLKSPSPDSPGPHASPKTQIAVTCEAVSRLSAMDTQPMNRLLGFGARYLNEFHSVWAKEQGGYEAAFESDDEDDTQ